MTYSCKFCGREFKTYRGVKAHAWRCPEKEEREMEIEKEEEQKKIIKRLKTPIHIEPAAPIQRRTLVKVGRNYIDPSDVSGIRETKSGWFIIELKSRPNPTFPAWAKEEDLDTLLKYIEVVE